MKVSDLSKRSGVCPHTIRYYVRAGLIRPRRNPANNYKRFQEEDLGRLRFIKVLQALGFSLSEIAGFIAGMEQGDCPCSSIQRQLADKLIDTRRELAVLERRLALMQRVYDRWDASKTRDSDLGALCRDLESNALSNEVVEIGLSITQLSHAALRGNVHPDTQHRRECNTTPKPVNSQQHDRDTLRRLQECWPGSPNPR